MPSATGGVRREPSSFRDPSGYLYWQNGIIRRCVRAPYQLQFDKAIATGLFRDAVARRLLLPFEMRTGETADQCIAVLQPVQLPFISYPFEWSFGQLKDAALTTLDLHLLALDHGMLLKDASAYNVQFSGGQPVFVDHLSFDRIEDHSAWPGYGQFCRHFLAPLALMSYTDLALGKLLALYIDGIPLDLAAKLLPRRTRFSPGLYMHLHLHAKMSAAHAGDRKSVKSKNLTAAQLKAIAGSLRALVARLHPRHQATEWGAYYSDTNYTAESFAAKQAWVREMVTAVSPRVLWDMGGNDGRFARSLRDLARDVVCLDIDPIAVDSNYAVCRRDGVDNVLPLLFDFCNPSPAIGLANTERPALLQRGTPDLVLALALIHHIAIANNVPLGDAAQFFAQLTPHLIIEFVSKADSQVQRLLANRDDIFDQYTEDGFRAAFEEMFEIVDQRRIPGTERTLFHMRRRNGSIGAQAP